MSITSISLDDPRLTTVERNQLWRIALRLDHAQDYVPAPPLKPHGWLAPLYRPDDLTDENQGLGIQW